MQGRAVPPVCDLLSVLKKEEENCAETLSLEAKNRTPENDPLLSSGKCWVNVHNKICSLIIWVASKSDNPTFLPVGGMHLVYISHLGAEKQVRSVIRLQEWDFDFVTATVVGAF